MVRRAERAVPRAKGHGITLDPSLIRPEVRITRSDTGEIQCEAVVVLGDPKLGPGYYDRLPISPDLILLSEKAQ